MTDAARPTIDLTGALDPSIDEVTATVPSDPAYREGHNMWIWDDAGQLNVPRMAVEVVGATWETARERRRSHRHARRAAPPFLV